ncbi:hypothetical protein BH10ACI3_BH10ACI3_21110 [soil metagenome]
MTIPYKKIPLSFDVKRLTADAHRFTGSDWEPHFNIHYYEGDWSVVPLRAAKGANTDIFPDPAAGEGYYETLQMSLCEYIPELLHCFKCDLQTVRFMKLAAGAQIKRHRDYILGLEDGFVRIHIPVTTNPDVEFILNDESVNMLPGEAWYMNVNFHHSVINGGGTDRIHLVVDCVVNEWMREMIEAQAA